MSASGVGDAGDLRPFKALFDAMLPDAEHIADPFHVMRLANDNLDDVLPLAAGSRTNTLRRGRVEITS